MKRLKLISIITAALGLTAGGAANGASYYTPSRSTQYGGVSASASTASRSAYGEPPSASAAYQPYKRSDKGSAADIGIYVGLRGDFTMANFSVEHDMDPAPISKTTDSYGMEPHIGGDVVVGYQSGSGWRVELNYWYGGTFGDKDDDMTFDMGWHAFTLNGIFNIKEWTTTSIYGGLGIGAGMLGTKYASHTGRVVFDPSAETEKTSIGLAANAQIGIEEKVSDGVYVGLTYRLGYLSGHTQNILLDDGDTLILKNSGILTNTLGLGARFAF